ncbi:hypothetical protein PENSPDRAFT_401175, partial [Peniophora sp. CONT]
MATELLSNSPPLSRRSSSAFASSSSSSSVAPQDVSDLDFHLCFGDSAHPQLDIPPVSPTYAFPETPVTPFTSASSRPWDIQSFRPIRASAESSPSASSYTSGSSSYGSTTYSSGSSSSSSSSPSSSSGSISPFSLADDYDEKLPLSPASPDLISPGAKDLLPEFVLGGTLAVEFGLAHSPLDALDADAFPISPHSPEFYRSRFVLLPLFIVPFPDLCHAAVVGFPSSAVPPQHRATFPPISPANSTSHRPRLRIEHVIPSRARWQISHLPLSCTEGSNPISASPLQQSSDGPASPSDLGIVPQLMRPEDISITIEGSVSKINTTLTIFPRSTGSTNMSSMTSETMAAAPMAMEQAPALAASSDSAPPPPSGPPAYMDAPPVVEAMAAQPAMTPTATEAPSMMAETMNATPGMEMADDAMAAPEKRKGFRNLLRRNTRRKPSEDISAMAMVPESEVASSMMSSADGASSMSTAMTSEEGAMSMMAAPM